MKTNQTEDKKSVKPAQILKKYKTLDKRVYDYMESVIDAIDEKYHGIKTEWVISLDLLAQTYHMYLLAFDDVCKTGVIVKGKDQAMVKNPSVTIANNSQAYIQRLLMQFGFTPVTESKAKVENNNDDDDIFN